MGFFESLEIEDYDREYDDRLLLSRMAQYLKPHVRALLVVSVMMLIQGITGAASPIVISRGVDLLAKPTLIVPSLPGKLAFLGNPDNIMLFLIGIVVTSGVLYWISNWVRRRLTVRVLSDVILKLRTDAFSASVGHDLSFFDKFSSGRIVSRITSDTREFGDVVVIITDVISQLIESVILGIALIYIEWRLALLIFAFVPVVFLLAIGFRRWARQTTQRGMRAMSNVNAAIMETVSGIAIAKNFRQESNIYNEFNGANVTSYRVNVQRGLVLVSIFPTLNALAGIAVGLVAYVGGLQAVKGVISVGAWYLFIVSLDRFWFPILDLSSFWAKIQSGLSAAERVFALIDAEPAVIQVDHKPVPRLKAEIFFDKVWFRYAAEEEVLCDFSLRIRPGENLALVGHTGAGKSSIVKLIARFYEFQQGQILVDGQDIRSFELAAYRRQLGIVSQMPFLFSGTIMDNIRYARPEATDAEIESMAYQIGNGEWLETLPNHLNTEVGERGNRLSMGQRQLVALLRVLVQRPAIFVLDEATASIDPFTEWQIQQAINLILKNSTSILIAHRLSTVKAADRIVVLEKGHIIEEGNHQGLMVKGGHYATLYNTYFRHQSLEYVEQVRELTLV